MTTNRPAPDAVSHRGGIVTRIAVIDNRATGGAARIIVNGTDITARVSAIRWQSGADVIPYVTITLIPDEFVASGIGLAEIEVGDAETE